MKLSIISIQCICACICIILISCTSEQRPNDWSTYIDKIGTYSSPRTADLNRDGVLDIVLGAGGKEEVFCDSAIIAIDGSNGKILWSLAGVNQYVGSAVFLDIDRDSVSDVVIGGRWAQLTAVSGASGKRLWTFFPERTEPSGADSGWYNYSTPQLIEDIDDDGRQDLLIANGGNAKVAPHDANRPVGRLMIISSINGKILADARVPDGKEIYMSPVCYNEPTSSEKKVLFGTGGETIGGHLYQTTIKAIRSGDLSKATILASAIDKGFIASPVLADINMDNSFDIIVNTVDGRMLAIDGSKKSVLWEVKLPGTEGYTMPAVGYFTDDKTPDFFANFAIGTFPNLPYSVRFMVDGKTGAIQYKDTVAAFQYASPLAIDINNDGTDEALVNQNEMRKKQFENEFYSHLFAFDFKNNQQYSLGDTLPATNLASTPWLGDLDGDKKIDIIYNAVKYENARFDLQTPLGLFIKCYKTEIPWNRAISWSAFMGTSYDCVFSNE